MGIFVEKDTTSTQKSAYSYTVPHILNKEKASEKRNVRFRVVWLLQSVFTQAKTMESCRTPPYIWPLLTKALPETSKP